MVLEHESPSSSKPAFPLFTFDHFALFDFGDSAAMFLCELGRVFYFANGVRFYGRVYFISLRAGYSNLVETRKVYKRSQMDHRAFMLGQLDFIVSVAEHIF